MRHEDLPFVFSCESSTTSWIPEFEEKNTAMPRTAFVSQIRQKSRVFGLEDAPNVPNQSILSNTKSESLRPVSASSRSAPSVATNVTTANGKVRSRAANFEDGPVVNAFKILDPRTSTLLLYVV